MLLPSSCVYLCIHQNCTFFVFKVSFCHTHEGDMGKSGYICSMAIGQIQKIAWIRKISFSCNFPQESSPKNHQTMDVSWYPGTHTKYPGIGYQVNTRVSGTRVWVVQSLAVCLEICCWLLSNCVPKYFTSNIIKDSRQNRVRRTFCRRHRLYP